MSDGPWSQWAKHVLAELKRHNENQTKIFERMEDIGKEIAGLKVKSGVWGLVGGLIPVAIVIAVLLIKNGMGAN